MDELANITIENNEAEQTPVAPADKTPEDRVDEIPEFVPTNAILLHTHDYGTKVFVARCSDRKKINYFFYVASPDGEVSEPVAKPLTKLTGKKGFDFLMDMEGDFDKQDTDTIRNTFNNIVKKPPIITVNTKTPISAIYKVLCDKVDSIARITLEDPESGGPYATRILDIKEDGTYGNIPVEDFNSLFTDMKKAEVWIGWKAVHIKQELKRLGKLRCNEPRYDYAVEDDRRAISIKLPEGWCLSDD